MQWLSQKYIMYHLRINYDLEAITKIYLLQKALTCFESKQRVSKAIEFALHSMHHIVRPLHTIR